MEKNNSGSSSNKYLSTKFMLASLNLVRQSL
jgi:hypothetical protein